MKKLKTLKLSFCSQLQEFPDIQSNMDSLVTLDLSDTEANLHLLKSLKDLELSGNDFHQGMSVILKLPQFPRFLRKLDLSYYSLGDGDIPYDICELLHLQILDLSSNSFSRLPSGISRNPYIKFLNLSYCDSLVELLDLPSSISILEADCCDSLEKAGDLSHYKWLWKVSLWGCDKLIDSERVLLSMLEGNAAADRFMSLEVSPNVEPSKIYMRLVKLQLPHNWCSDFSGFLLESRIEKAHFRGYKIVIKQDMSTNHYEKFGEDWKRLSYENAGYIPFSSLRHIPWFNPTCTTNISFHTNEGVLSVSLVRSKCKVGDLSECPIDYSECWDEAHGDIKTFKIIYDSESSEIQISWRP
ncbi:hypothetical protein M8C21_028228 [Ambrosia artemisiifolia]|uniref:Uncharacterized protein n=1 Tax=Ambrosia artemisiifolia TaxID=4212 RepID=A0AAD5GRC4_AMBAR|nr:hypothetical protein M8C21_028228 [Ambrosia artemisiifolia]